MTVKKPVYFNACVDITAGKSVAGPSVVVRFRFCGYLNLCFGGTQFCRLMETTRRNLFFLFILLPSLFALDSLLRVAASPNGSRIPIGTSPGHCASRAEFRDRKTFAT